MEEEMADEAGQEDGPAPPDEEVAACLTKTQFAACAKQWTRPKVPPLDPATDEVTFQQSEVCRRRCPPTPTFTTTALATSTVATASVATTIPSVSLTTALNRHHPNHHQAHRHGLRASSPFRRRLRTTPHRRAARPTGGLHDRQRDPRADGQLHAGGARRRAPHVRHHGGRQQRHGARARLLPIPVRACAGRLHAGALRGVPADAGAAPQGGVAEGAPRQPGAHRSYEHPACTPVHPACTPVHPACTPVHPACNRTRRRCSTCAWSRSSRSCTSSLATWATS